MNTLCRSAFCVAHSAKPVHWPLTRDRDLASSCDLGSTVGNVFVYDALDRVFASMTFEGVTEFWQILSLTSSHATVQKVTPCALGTR
jgi:hypothetical protein